MLLRVACSFYIFFFPLPLDIEKQCKQKNKKSFIYFYPSAGHQPNRLNNDCILASSMLLSLRHFLSQCILHVLHKKAAPCFSHTRARAHLRFLPSFLTYFLTCWRRRRRESPCRWASWWAGRASSWRGRPRRSCRSTGTPARDGGSRQRSGRRGGR